MQNRSNLRPLVGKPKKQNQYNYQPRMQIMYPPVPSFGMQIPFPEKDQGYLNQGQLQDYNNDNPLFISFEDQSINAENTTRCFNPAPNTSVNSKKNTQSNKKGKNKTTPVQKGNNKNKSKVTRAPSATEEFNALLKEKQNLLNDYKRNPSEENHAKFLRLNEELKSKIENARKNVVVNVVQSQLNTKKSNQKSRGKVMASSSQGEATSQMNADNDTNASRSNVYSPTVICLDDVEQETSLELSDVYDDTQKRTSAFERLGPLTQAKKPKLTINLSLKEDQSVREVVDESHLPGFVPFHEREDVVSSTDEMVVKYLPLWPWKKTLSVRKSCTSRPSKSVMMMEKEQSDEAYAKDSWFVMVTIKGYPPSWTKEDVLDALLANLKGKSFIPCFIEFNTNECKFLVLRNRMALLEIHSFGFIIRQENVELSIVISQVVLTVKHLDFIPKLMLRRRLTLTLDGSKLDLKAFTLQEDISHFIYFPLNRVYNQREMTQMQSDVRWQDITELDLSYNRLKSLDGFNLHSHAPNLRVLDISHNCIESITNLLACRNLPLRKLKLEGNPLCLNYVEAEYYVEVVRTLFPCLRELDGEKIFLDGEMPTFKQNFCPEEAMPIVEKFLETFFRLLDLNDDDRECIKDMYDGDAVLSITYRNKIRYESDHKHYHNLFVKSRNLEQKVFDVAKGAAGIVKIITKWPRLLHDPTTFTVDVMYHDDSTTIVKVIGVLKLLTESLAENEQVLAFSRTVVLHTTDGVEYKIKKEMLYWDEPTREYADAAFKLASIQSKPLDLKFETTPDENVQEQLITIFMKLTGLEAKPSRRCLEIKEWHFKNSLEYFTKLLKLDNTRSLYETN